MGESVSPVPEKEQSKGLSEEAKQYTRDKGYEGVIAALLVAVLAICGGLIAYFIQKEHNGDVHEAFGRLLEYFGRKAPEPGVRVASQDAKPDYPISFSVHFNGDGLGEGILTSSKDWNGLDEMIKATCEKFVDNDDLIDKSQCLPSNGARLFIHTGVRVYSFLDIKEGSRTYIVPQGLHFVWPLSKVGDYIYPECVESPIEDKPIRLKQLSMSPRVFQVENFMTPEEMEKLIEHNRELVKPSEVGFAGWRDSTRTSSTSWDFSSWAAKRIQRRSFDIVGMSFEHHLADAVQVLRYNLNEWYKPHTDWFDAKGYDGHDPTINNGTNRFVTVFLYLTDVEEGGHTVFPLSTTHEGYNGEQLVHPGTEKTAGYISNTDAQWVCNTSSTALRSTPKAGNAVIFYSQGPRGELDKYSLHGGCPVIRGTKWSANVWIWNRPKPDKSKAKDGKNKPSSSSDSIHVRFKNTRNEDISIYWDDGSDEMVFQMTLKPDDMGPMTTYKGHRFVARNNQKQQLGDYRANPEDDDKEIQF